jgi:acetoin utilization protein AcuB
MSAGYGKETVADVMTARVTSIAPDRSVLEAVSVFGECGFRHLLIVDADGNLAGVLSDRDALRSMARTHDPERTRVSTVMARDLVVATPEMPLAEAIELLVRHRINCLPVVDASGRACGIVTTTDLLKAFRAALEHAAGRPAGCGFTPHRT